MKAFEHVAECVAGAMCVQVQRMLRLQMFVEGFGGGAMPRKSSRWLRR